MIVRLYHHNNANNTNMISFVVPLLLSLLVLYTDTNENVLFARASTASSTSSSAVANAPSSKQQQQRPSWLDHIDRDTMKEYMDLAKKQHEDCIKQARAAYDVKPTDPDPIVVSDEMVLEPHSIRSNGKLPDFGDELEKKCYVTSPGTPLFTREECSDLIEKAERHFATNNNGKWTTLPSGQYDVAGFWIRDIPEAHEWFLGMVQKRLFPLLAKTFPDFCEKDALVVDNAYVFKYTTETGRRTDVHTDSGCLTFTISLNPAEDYKGGGTWFEGLEEGSGGENNNNNGVIEMNVGQVTFRPGGVRHCGHAVTEGTRYIIGGFCMDQRKVEYVRMLMRYAHETKDKEKEQTALEVAIALNPQFDATYTVLADIYKKQGKVSKAQAVLEHCLEHVNPDCGDVAYSLGNIYYENKRYRDAKKCMDACLRVDDTDADAMAMQAQVAAQTNEKDEEQWWYEKIISTPGRSDQRAASAYCNLGVLHEGTDQEIEFYKKSLEFVPDSFAAHYSLGCAYASKSRLPEAAASFRRTLLPSTKGGNDEQKNNALKNLYRVACQLLQSSGVPLGSQQEMITKIQDIMGKQNYQQLAATAGK